MAEDRRQKEISTKEGQRSEIRAKDREGKRRDEQETFIA